MILMVKLVFFFYLHRVSESLRDLTNPQGAQALSKEFPANAPQINSNFNSIR